MREFGTYISPETEAKLRAEVESVFALMPDKSDVFGADFAMDEPDAKVITAADLKLADGQRFRLSRTENSARPPFEWLWEISSDLGESEYFKHYLIRETDTVMAQRKEIFPIDEPEAEIILADLKFAREALANPELLAKAKRTRRRKVAE